MPRPSEIQAEENTAPRSPLRRSCRIVAVSSPAPSEAKPLRGRRLSATSTESKEDANDETRAVRTTRASSISKENSDPKPEPAKTRTRRPSGSVEISVKEETKPASTRGRRSSVTKEESGLDKPKPLRGRRGSVTTEDEKEKNEETEKKLITRRIVSIQEEKEEVSSKKSIKTRRSSVQEEKEEDSTKKPIKKRRSSIQEDKYELLQKNSLIQPSVAGALDDDFESNQEILPISSKATLDTEKKTELIEKITRNRSSSVDTSVQKEDSATQHTPVKPKRRLSITELDVNLEPIGENEQENLSPTKTTSELVLTKKKIDQGQAQSQLDLSIILETSATEENETNNLDNVGNISKDDDNSEKKSTTSNLSPSNTKFEKGRQTPDSPARRSPRLMEKCKSGKHNHWKCNCEESSTDIIKNKKIDFVCIQENKGNDSDDVCTKSPDKRTEVLTVNIQKLHPSLLDTKANDYKTNTSFESPQKSENDLDDSKCSGSSDKENIHENTEMLDKAISLEETPKEKSVLEVSLICKKEIQQKVNVGRVSNVFKPKDVDYSFMEPMDVDPILDTSKLNKSHFNKTQLQNETINDTCSLNLSTSPREMLTKNDLMEGSILEINLEKTKKESMLEKRFTVGDSDSTNLLHISQEKKEDIIKENLEVTVVNANSKVLEETKFENKLSLSLDETPSKIVSLQQRISEEENELVKILNKEDTKDISEKSTKVKTPQQQNSNEEKGKTLEHAENEQDVINEEYTKYVSDKPSEEVDFQRQNSDEKEKTSEESKSDDIFNKEETKDMSDDYDFDVPSEDEPDIDNKKNSPDSVSESNHSIKEKKNLIEDITSKVDIELSDENVEKPIQNQKASINTEENNLKEKSVKNISLSRGEFIQDEKENYSANKLIKTNDSLREDENPERNIGRQENVEEILNKTEENLNISKSKDIENSITAQEDIVQDSNLLMTATLTNETEVTNNEGKQTEEKTQLDVEVNHEKIIEKNSKNGNGLEVCVKDVVEDSNSENKNIAYEQKKIFEKNGKQNKLEETVVTTSTTKHTLIENKNKHLNEDDTSFKDTIKDFEICKENATESENNMKDKIEDAVISETIQEKKDGNFNEMEACFNDIIKDDEDTESVNEETENTNENINCLKTKSPVKIENPKELSEEHTEEKKILHKTLDEVIDREVSTPQSYKKSKRKSKNKLETPKENKKVTISPKMAKENSNQAILEEPQSNDKSKKEKRFSANEWFQENLDASKNLTPKERKSIINRPNDKELENIIKSSEILKQTGNQNDIVLDKKKNSSKPLLKESTNAKLDEYLTRKIGSFEAEENQLDEDSDSCNSIFDDMAEEGEEDTPSDDSNEIVDEGEAIHSDSERSEDDYHEEDDSFICDEETIELLSGEEYDLKDAKTKKKSRILNVENRTEEVINIEKKLKPEVKKRSRIIKVEDSSSDEEIINIDSSITEAPNNVFIENPTEQTKNLSRRSSINIIENIDVKEIKDSILSDRINQLVDSFCTTIPKRGDISMNLSLEFAGKPSSIEGKKSKKKVQRSKNKNKNKINSISGLNEQFKETVKRKSTSDEEIGPSKKRRLSASFIDDSTNKKRLEKRRLSRSMDDINNQTEKPKKKKNKKNKEHSLISNIISSENLRKQSFGLMGQLLTDVKNRPKRSIKPSSMKVNDLNSTWLVENDIQIKPSTSIISPKEIEDFKKKKLHNKDFKNQMLYNSNRIKRVDTKQLLRKKGAYY